MKRTTLGTAVVLLLGATGLAQVSHDEAMARLRERQAARQKEGTGVSAADAPAAPAAPARVPVEKIRSGLADLLAGNAAEALKVLLEAEKESPRVLPAKMDDPDLINLYHGIAYAYMTKGEFAKARSFADRAYAAKRGNRSIVLNVAKLDAQGKDQPRAIAALKKLVLATPEDEEAINLMGVALNRLAADRPALAAKHEAEFQAIQTRLERARPGFRRWGTEWVDEKTYAAIQTRRNAQLAKVRREERDVESAVDGVRSAQAKYQSEMAVPVNETVSARNYRQARQAEDGPRFQRYIDEANRELQRAKRELADAIAQVEKPTWNEDFTPVTPDLNLAEKI
jgi:tetratricopeptide (TPR) repeat protein